MRNFLYWIVTVSRGYSAPMSILNWLVVFVLTMKFSPNANALYGLFALVGIVFAHLGTNLLDDCVDYLLKIPKQKCKTAYLDNGFTTIKSVFVVTAIYFLIASAIGIFFIFNLGLPVLYLCIPSALIILLYSRLNNYALGEIAVGLCFGVLMFLGVNFVMTGTFSQNIVLISIPVSLLTVAVLYTHSLMDFDFDKESGKFTICQLLRTKKNALLGLMGIYWAAFGGTFWLILQKTLPRSAFWVIILFLPIVKLYFSMKKYNSAEHHDPSEFLVNFKLARNISVFYNLFLVFLFLIKG